MQGASSLDRVTSATAAAVARQADAAIVGRIAAGDRTAMAELYDRHSDVVFSLACRIVRLPADAEDVVQEVFTQAWRQASRYDATRASAAAWLLNITRTRAIDRLRAARTRQRISGGDERLELAPATGESQEDLVIGGERAERVRAALAILGDAQRTAIDLAYFGGLTHFEIAERLSEPLGTVKTRIRSGLMKLRDALMERT
ncbi:MAG: sigma-70 family RNA polymerase sigma factor [Vicinamibacterales bacterium]